MDVDDAAASHRLVLSRVKEAHRSVRGGRARVIGVDHWIACSEVVEIKREALRYDPQVPRLEKKL